MKYPYENFISEIKKIPTDELIFNLSEKSISMFVKGDYLMPINIPAIQFYYPTRGGFLSIVYFLRICSTFEKSAGSL